jgi:hypothetical protein
MRQLLYMGLMNCGVDMEEILHHPKWNDYKYYIFLFLLILYIYISIMG